MNTTTIRRAFLATGLALCAVLAVGCSRPQASSLENQQLINSLRTAVSARSAAWLEKCRHIIETRRADNKLTEAEYAEFHDILALAAENRWEQAEREVIRFQKSQRPLNEQHEPGAGHQRHDSPGAKLH